MKFWEKLNYYNRKKVIGKINGGLKCVCGEGLLVCSNLRPVY